MAKIVHPEFGNLRTIEIDGEPWFVGKDVAAALGYTKERNALDKHVDKDDALKRGVTDSMGRTQQMTIQDAHINIINVFGRNVNT